MESAANTIIKAIIMTAINSATPRLPPTRDGAGSVEAVPPCVATGKPHCVSGNRNRRISDNSFTINTT